MGSSTRQYKCFNLVYLAYWHNRGGTAKQVIITQSTNRYCECKECDKFKLQQTLQ